VIIKVLFAILACSVTALIGVAIAVFVRVWWQMKSRRAQAKISAEASQESRHGSLL
jgi:ABC-type Fe3+ transport system permease subunit